MLLQSIFPQVHTRKVLSSSNNNTRILHSFEHKPRNSHLTQFLDTVLSSTLFSTVVPWVT